MAEKLPTDNERREVARRLRAYGKEFVDATWRELCNVVLYDEDRYPSTVRKLRLIDRLADLIDPDTTMDTTKTPTDTTKRDRGALLELADEMDKWALTCDHYDRQVSPLDVTKYARRIREALGVSDG